MKTPENSLPITGFAIPEIDIDAEIKSSESPDCATYSNDFHRAACLAENDGKTEAAKLFRSLSRVCSYHPNYGDFSEPYRAFYIYKGERTAIPDDLSEADLRTIEQILLKVTDTALRARLEDILWIRDKNHKAAKDAVADYILAAQRLVTPELWIVGVELFKRALQIAHRLGRKNDAWQLAEQAFLNALKNNLAQTEPFYCCQLLDIAIQMQIGEPALLADIAHEQARKASLENDARREREYYRLAADFFKNCKKDAEEIAARIAIGEGYIKEADECLTRPSPSYSAASGFLAQGIEALRQAKADSKRIAELRERLSDFQRKSLSEMKTFKTELDIKVPVERAIKFVTVPKFEDAIKRLAFGPPFVEVQKLRNDVIEEAKKYPMMYMLDQSMLDSAGRVIEHTPGVRNLSGPELEKSIETHMFRHAGESIWSLRATAFIEPARYQVWRDHSPRQSELFYLVRDNPFIHRVMNLFLREDFFTGWRGICSWLPIFSLHKLRIHFALSLNNTGLMFPIWNPI